MFVELSVESQHQCELVDITERVQQVVADSGMEEGALLVFVPHTTAGITLNENWDPDVAADMLSVLDRLVPLRPAPADGLGYRHSEGNSAAHIRAALLGFSQTIPVHGGKLALGRWQGIFLTEFDGPRVRRLSLTIVSRDGVR